MNNENPFKDVTPINMDEIEPYQPETPVTLPNVPSSTTVNQEQGVPKVKSSNKLFVIIGAVCLVAIVIVVLFATGIIGNINKESVIIGDHVVMVNKRRYDIADVSGGLNNGSSFAEKNLTHRIFLYEIVEKEGYTYESLKSKDLANKLIRMSDSSASLGESNEIKGSNSKCIFYVLTAKGGANLYNSVGFCDTSDDGLFLAEVSSNTSSTDGLNEALEILDTAKVK